MRNEIVGVVGRGMTGTSGRERVVQRLRWLSVAFGGGRDLRWRSASEIRHDYKPQDLYLAEW